MTNQSSENQDIYLSEVSRKVKGYFSRINDSFFDAILFFKKNSIAIAVIVLLGAGYGYYADVEKNQYDTKIFVISNFESTDYLYQRVAFLSSKINNKKFKAATGLNKSKKIKDISIEPVLDIYNFVDNPAKETDQNERTYQIFKLISENGDVKKVMRDEVTSRNFKNHLITITSEGYASENEDIKPILEYINSSPYFKKIQKEYQQNLDIKIAANDTIIKQIDAILNAFPQSASKSSGVVLNDNSALNEMIRTKDRLLKEQNRNRIDKVNFDKIVNESSIALNVSDGSAVTGNMKFIAPLILFLLFVAFKLFMQYYKKQLKKRSIVITNP